MARIDWIGFSFTNASARLSLINFTFPAFQSLSRHEMLLLYLGDGLNCFSKQVILGNTSFSCRDFGARDSEDKRYCLEQFRIDLIIPAGRDTKIL